MIRILIIEDDPGFLKILKDSLSLEGYNLTTESDGEKGFKLALDDKPDLIILDIMLPSMSGFDVCKNLRMKNINTPIIMLTAKNDEVDKVLGLELGADDYVTKPFGIRELAARIKAVMRRRTSIEQDFDQYSFSDVRLDFRKMEATKGNVKIKLSLKEFEIMKYLIKNIDVVISRDKLLNDVWGFEVFPVTRTIDNFILSLRKKIETNPSLPAHLLTVRSSGYKFVK